MENKYKEGTIKNIFEHLDDDCSLWILGLCLASNDVGSFLKRIDNCPDEEKAYFFSISLSILRELAKHITTKIKKVNIEEYFSDHTNTLFTKLKHELEPIHTDSLTGSVLKPIRDTTFHYDFTFDKENKEKLSPFLEDLKNECDLKVKVDSEDKTVFGQRYFFADIFRHKFHNSFLDEGIVDKLSTVAFSVIAFIDSLLADLSSNIEK